ncbi:MAG: DUF5518 domain-containing protein [Haloferacaceae archaeon]
MSDRDDASRAEPGASGDAHDADSGTTVSELVVPPESADGSVELSRRAVFLPALVGATVTFLVVFVPFAPALGGAVAGYLRDGMRREGASVGGLSGLLVALPVGLVGPFVLALVAPVPPGAAPVRGVVAVLGLALVVLLVAVVYFVGLGAAGGVVGVALRERNR